MQNFGMSMLWFWIAYVCVTVHEIIDIFSKHHTYAKTDKMRRGMYLREYTALTEIVQ